jgi:hypothetical protein
MEIRRLRLARGKMERAMSFLTTSRAPAFVDQKEGSRSFYLALPQQSLYNFPDPQGHLSLGFGMEHLQLLASYTEHCTFRVSARQKFHGSAKKGPDLWSRASRRTRVHAYKSGSEIGNESSVHAQHDKPPFKVSCTTNC